MYTELCSFFWNSGYNDKDKLEPNDHNRYYNKNEKNI